MMLARNVLMAGLIVTAAWAGTAQAQMKDLDPALAEKGTYVIDSSHAGVVWKVWHMGFSHYVGRFNKVTGTLSYDPAKPEASSVTVAIDTASADTDNAKLNAELADAMFFDANTYPTITFTSTKVEVGGVNADGKTYGKVTGDLTLKGKTRPVVLDVVFNGSGAHPMTKKTTMGFSATGMLKRSEFGVDYGIPMVGDEVEFQIEVELNRAG